METGLAPPRCGAPSQPSAGSGWSSVRCASETRGPVRFFAWSSDAGRRVETVRAVLTERGLRVSGTIVTVDARPTSTSYALLCDAAGRTRRVNVRSESPATERGLSLTRTPDGPWLDGVGRPPPGADLAGAADIHLSSSVFTVSLAIRRLGLHRGPLPGPAVTVTAAHILLPDLSVGTVVRRLRVVGPVERGLQIQLEGNERGRFTVDDEGFVVDVEV